MLELVDGLPRTQKGKVICYQLVKAATSVGANYRAACRARSRREYIAKLQIVLEEADEAHFWLEVVRRGRLLPEGAVRACHREANDLTAIFNASLFRGRNENVCG